MCYAGHSPASVLCCMALNCHICMLPDHVLLPGPTLQLHLPATPVLYSTCADIASVHSQRRRPRTSWPSRHHQACCSSSPAAQLTLQFLMLMAWRRTRLCRCLTLWFVHHTQTWRCLGMPNNASDTWQLNAELMA